MNHKIRCYQYKADGSVPLVATFVAVSRDMARGFVYLYMLRGVYDIIEIEYEVLPKLFVPVETWQRPETHPEYGYRRV